MEICTIHFGLYIGALWSRGGGGGGGEALDFHVEVPPPRDFGVNLTLFRCGGLIFCLVYS